MNGIKLIEKTIDKYLEDNHITEIKAVDAAQILDKKGVLKDSLSRPGKPLRDLLRAGKLPNSIFREGQRDKWFLIHS